MEEVVQQIQALVQAAMSGDEQANAQIQQIMQAAQQGNQEAIKYAQIIQQMMSQSAKFGAKLNYVKFLRGQCPDGFDMQTFKKGGAICRRCVKRKKEGGEMSDPITAFKCGRKMKKKK